MWGRKSKVTLAKIAGLKAGKNAYSGRKLKKRDMRALFQIRISAAVREQGLSYSKFMGLVHKAGIALDRKIMSQLAAKHPKIFNEVVAAAKK